MTDRYWQYTGVTVRRGEHCLLEASANLVLVDETANRHERIAMSVTTLFPRDDREGSLARAKELIEKRVNEATGLVAVMKIL